jgi:hypothetical protein
MEKKKIQQIDYACEVGDEVFYLNDFRGEKFYGTLSEWKGNIAIIEMADGTVKEFEC